VGAVELGAAHGRSLVSAFSASRRDGVVFSFFYVAARRRGFQLFLRGGATAWCAGSF
jgi:hypothetical protein